MIIKLLIGLLIGGLCGLLGAYSGAENTSKAIRRFGIPILLTGFACAYLWSFWGLLLLLLFVPISAGYGVPCWNDDGSMIGRFWYDLIKKVNKTIQEIDVQELASILTRSTIGLIVSLISIVIPILKGNWLIYLLSSSIIIATYACLSWRGLGGFTFLKKYLTLSEFFTYLAIGIGLSLTILF